MLEGVCVFIGKISKGFPLFIINIYKLYLMRLTLEDAIFIGLTKLTKC